jgi:hypothetical protein
VRRELVAERDKAHRLVFDLSRHAPGPAVPAARQPEDRSARAPWAAVIATGISALGLGSFAYFGLSGLARRNQLDVCGQHCQQSDIDYARTHFTVADVSLGVSAIALGAAIYFWATWASGQQQTQSASLVFSPRAP